MARRFVELPWGQATSGCADALTGVLGREEAVGRLDDELARARREQQELSIGILDVDGLARVNERYGRPAGDAVLREVVRRLRAMLRPYDVVGRLGGEEFLIVLSKTGELQVADVLDRLRGTMAAEPFAHAGHELEITVTIGGVSGIDEPAGELIARARRSLDEAQAAGPTGSSPAGRRSSRPSSLRSDGRAIASLRTRRAILLPGAHLRRHRDLDGSLRELLARGGSAAHRRDRALRRDPVRGPSQPAGRGQRARRRARGTALHRARAVPALRVRQPLVAAAPDGVRGAPPSPRRCRGARRPRLRGAPRPAAQAARMGHPRRQDPGELVRGAGGAAGGVRRRHRRRESSVRAAHALPRSGGPGPARPGPRARRGSRGGHGDAQGVAR